MEVLLRQKGRPWTVAKEAAFTTEGDLQQMLYDSPMLIPVKGEGDVARIFIREAGLPGSGNTDLLGVDENGNIYIVECKLASNQEIRRKVIGQVLEYAAFLWEMSFDDFSDLFRRRLGKSVLDLIRAKSLRPLDAERIRGTITENLKLGSFCLMIAVDRMNDELEQVIRYLARYDSSIGLEAIELGLFGTEDTEVIVPKIHGRELQEDRLARTLTTPEKVIEGSDQPDIVRSLILQWQALGHIVAPGTKGLSFRAQIGHNERPVFWGFHDFISIGLSTMREHGLPDDVIGFCRKQIATVPGFDPQKALSQSEPRAYFVDFDETTVKRIIGINHDIVLKFRELMKSDSSQETS